MNCSPQTRWLTPDPLGGDVTDPQSLNRYAYVTNNPTSLNDPLGLDPEACWTFSPYLPGCGGMFSHGGGGGGFNPADRCSDPSFAASHAQCGGPTGFPSMTPWGGFPLPPFGGIGGGGASSPGQPPLGGIGGDVDCGAFGCVSPPFQGAFQGPINPRLLDEILTLLLEYGSKGWKYIKPCLQYGAACKEFLKLAGRGVKAAANDALGCADAPCIQKALQNIQEQQANGTWNPQGGGPVVQAKQPTVITVTPAPKKIVPNSFNLGPNLFSRH